MSDRIAIASRDVGIRKPLSRGWHAELPGPFERHDVYREYKDGTRMHQGTLTSEAVKAWQKAVSSTPHRNTRASNHGPAEEGRS